MKYSSLLVFVTWRSAEQLTKEKRLFLLVLIIETFLEFFLINIMQNRDWIFFGKLAKYFFGVPLSHILDIVYM